MIDLTAAGLNETEATCYQALLSRKEWQPSVLANYVSQSRTNMYKILDKLVGLGLAEKFDLNKKIHYRATNPTRLLQLAQEARTQREKAEKELSAQTQTLMNEYVKTHEQAGIRYFQGEQEITDIFKQIATSSEEVVFVHTRAGADFYGFSAMHNLRMLAVNARVKRRAITPDTESASKDFAQSDPLVLLERTWLKKNDYTAPVEWGAFDGKLYIIAYGKDAMGLIIESQPIAAAFKQLFALLERGQKLLPDYNKLPKLATKKGVTTPHLPER